MSEFELLTDHGWQMTSIPVKTGDVVRIMVTGQYRIGETELDEDRFLPWTCEGNGITIRYHLGRPLGRVLAGTFNKTANSPLEKIKGITDPIDVGKKAEIKIKHDGFLCFRINESTKEMSDNQGTLAVRIVKLE